jgi:hypothetical protein
MEVHLLRRQNAQRTGEVDLPLACLRVNADLPDRLHHALAVGAIRPLALIGPDRRDADRPGDVAEREEYEGIAVALGLLHLLDDEQLVLDALPDCELREIQRRHSSMVRSHASAGKHRRRTPDRRTAGRLRRQSPCSCRRSPESSATRTARTDATR